MDSWDRIKDVGSIHYKTGGIEPIDLFRDTKPHGSHTALTVKALTDTIKYAYRMLTTGVNHQDCDKISHYIDMCRWSKDNQTDDKPVKAADLYAGKGVEELVIGTKKVTRGQE